MKSRKIYVATIAGYDSSGGAGVLADIKTFEAHKIYGFGILTAITWQNDIEIARIQWLKNQQIIQQLSMVMKRFQINWFKIGIIKNLKMLQSITSFIRDKNSKSNIIWDPVLKSSCGVSFMKKMLRFEKIINHVNIITPNTFEFKKIFSSKERALAYSKKQIVYRKGGDRKKKAGKDTLYWKGKQRHFKSKIRTVFPKHGSGCVFSSALCANLSKGYSLEEACKKSKRYTENFLLSDSDLLGWHKTIKD